MTPEAIHTQHKSHNTTQKWHRREIKGKLQVSLYKDYSLKTNSLGSFCKII